MIDFPFAEMFGELKQDLEADVAAADEDPETHYNLGIAFREMGLLDEAMASFARALALNPAGVILPEDLPAAVQSPQPAKDGAKAGASAQFNLKATPPRGFGATSCSLSSTTI